MAKQFLHTLTVEGRGMFPIDMLRYDYLSPNTEADSGKIVSRTMYKGTEPVQVSRYAERWWEPTQRRWESFGWRVTKHIVRLDTGDKEMLV